MKPLLRFQADGTFKIVQFTDLHMKNGDEKDEQSLKLMKEIATMETPDLIVFTGDLIQSRRCDNAIDALHQVISVPEKLGIPWALVFGNHDSEGDTSRAELMASIRDTEYGLSEPGPSQVSGVGNYVLPVYGVNGSNEKLRLYFLDSGDRAPSPVDGYAWIKPDQIAWYLAQSQEAADRAGEAIPALAFFHIPIPEFDELWLGGHATGTKEEKVCCAKVNSGLFAAMLERGDMIAAFVGHDHVNDYGGNWFGIGLYYGRATGYNTYGFQSKGARVIRMREGSCELETWIRLDSGEELIYKEESNTK